MKTGKSSASTAPSLCMIDLDAEIVIDLIDFERIKAASSAIKFLRNVCPPLFNELEDAINSINNKPNNSDFDSYPNFGVRTVYVPVDPLLEIVIDLIDFERINTVLSAIKSNFYGYMSLFGAGGSRFGDAVILLEDAIKNINNSINTKSSNRYVDNKTKTDIY